MTTDIFIAGLIGMTLIALAIAVLSYLYGPCENQDHDVVEPSSLPNSKRLTK